MKKCQQLALIICRFKRSPGVFVVIRNFLTNQTAVIFSNPRRNRYILVLLSYKPNKDTLLLFPDFSPSVSERWTRHLMARAPAVCVLPSPCFSSAPFYPASQRGAPPPGVQPSFCGFSPVTSTALHRRQAPSRRKIIISPDKPSPCHLSCSLTLLC